MCFSQKKYCKYRQSNIEDMEILSTISVGISSEMAILRDKEISEDENYWKYLFSIAESYINNENE